jgi:hypothetical protein
VLSRNSEISGTPSHRIMAAAGDSNYVRVQILTPAGVLDRAKQLGVVKEMTGIIAAAAGDPGLIERTWVDWINLAFWYVYRGSVSLP